MDDAKRMKGGNPEELRAVVVGSESHRTRMAYMADLLLELRDMAASEGHSTLAGLLALAHVEALTKSR